jgi:DNA modification methylase
MLTEERMDEAKHAVAKLTAGTIPVRLNDSNEQETEIAVIEAVETGQTIGVPLSRMLRLGKMEDIIPTLPPESVDHIITDWPYAIDMDTLVQSQGMDVSRVAAEHDVESNLADYPTWLKAMYYLLKPKSYCVVWYDNVHWNLIRHHAEQVGFRVQRWPLVWIKTSPCLNQMANKNWTKATEFAIVLSKQNATLTKPQPTNYWSGPRASTTSNPFAKPKGLWQWILSAFALQGDIICDPFAGECSSLLAAVDFGCRVIGMESNENHFNQGMANVRELYSELTKGNVNFT